MVESKNNLPCDKLS